MPWSIKGQNVIDIADGQGNVFEKSALTGFAFANVTLTARTV